MEKSTSLRHKKRFVDAPRQVDQWGEPVRIKILEPQPVTRSLDTNPDIRIVRAICPRGVSTEEIRHALFSSLHLLPDSDAPESQVIKSPPHEIERSRTRSVKFVIPMATTH